MFRLPFALVLLLTACDEAPPATHDASSPVDAGSTLGDAAPPATDAGAINASRTVSTTSGDVVGAVDDGVEIFRSIPYAAPPIGDLRFERPQPHPGWSDVLDTANTDSDLSCPQLDRMSGAQLGEEDCLVLNVYAPRDASGRPVMVFVHGGAFTGGSANDPLYHGASLARGDVVVFTLNYRLGILGFLAASGLVESDGGAGNLGLWDQRLALQWIRENAAAFGGDADNITIFGESAGAVSVLAQMTSPESTDLFARAIAQSGGGGFVPTQAEVFTRYLPILTTLGCDGADDLRACLRALDVSTILDATNSAGMSALGLPAIGPHLDGVFLVEQPYDVLASGARDVPFMNGSNADEATIFTRGVTIPSMAAFRGFLEGMFDTATVDGIVAIYNEDTFGTPKAAFDKFFGEVGFVCPTLALAAAGAEGEPAYLYHFTRVLPSPIGSALGAFHGLELFYLFGNFDVAPGYTPNADDAALVETLQRAWVGYAADGSPDFAPGWAPYSRSTPDIAILDEPPSSADTLVEGRCAELAALSVTMP